MTKISHNYVMAYRLEYRASAHKELKKLPADRRLQILQKLQQLTENPDDPSLDVKKLVGREGYRLRVGTYRVLYERYEDCLLILVLAVRPRGQAYRR